MYVTIAEFKEGLEVREVDTALLTDDIGYEVNLLELHKRTDNSKSLISERTVGEIQRFYPEIVVRILSQYTEKCGRLWGQLSISYGTIVTPVVLRGSANPYRLVAIL